MNSLRRAIIAFLAAAALFVPTAASAGTPALQINPLQYEDTLGDKVKSGHVDVSNPSDSPVIIETAVRGFKQTGTDGDLVFFDDTDLSLGIKVDLKEFQLGPREAVRIGFTANPSKLPSGGNYAAIFFKTRPADQSSKSSYVLQSANVGTLLMLRNGGADKPLGTVANVSIPFWNFGDGLSGTTTMRNAGNENGGIAYRPDLSVKVLPWGKKHKLATGLILPATNRTFSIERPGSFFGILPVTVTDSATRASSTKWVIACTGLYPSVFLITFCLFLSFILSRLIRRRRAASPAVRSLDGLSRKL